MIIGIDRGSGDLSRGDFLGCGMGENAANIPDAVRGLEAGVLRVALGVDGVDRVCHTGVSKDCIEIMLDKYNEVLQNDCGDKKRSAGLVTV